MIASAIITVTDCWGCGYYFGPRIYSCLRAKYGSCLDCTFLYDFAYLVLDFKQGVRANRSTHLDLLWREFFSIGRTGTANKTQYVPMSIMRFLGRMLSFRHSETFTMHCVLFLCHPGFMLAGTVLLNGLMVLLHLVWCEFFSFRAAHRNFR